MSTRNQIMRCSSRFSSGLSLIGRSSKSASETFNLRMAKAVFMFHGTFTYGVRVETPRCLGTPRNTECTPIESDLLARGEHTMVRVLPCWSSPYGSIPGNPTATLLNPYLATPPSLPEYSLLLTRALLTPYQNTPQSLREYS